jgi:hypothetical protein
MEQSTQLPRTSAEPATRIQAVRSRLPGQMLRQRLELAAVAYGPLYTLPEVREKVGATLRWRAGYVRGAVLDTIEEYRGVIPDDALLKYDDAVQSGLFSKFLVATPTYYQERQVDPWIIAEVTGTDRYAVIAQWDV